MSDTQTIETTPPTQSRGPSLIQLIIVVVVLGAGILITALTSDVTKVSEPGIRVVNDQPVLPETVGPWTGGELSGLSEQERAILPKDTQGARRLYKDAAGHELYCSIVLAGRDVTSIHRPELCLPGQGWQYHEWIESVPVSTAPGGKLEVMRMNASHEMHLPDGRSGVAQAIFLYWFVGKDRTTARHAQRIWWTTVDRVFHNTNHRWAYILIHVPVMPNATNPTLEQAQDASMKVASQFVQDLYPSLQKK